MAKKTILVGVPVDDTEDTEDEEEIDPYAVDYITVTEESIKQTSESTSSDSTASEESEASEMLLTQNMNGIFGLPYQFLSTVDRRTREINNGDSMGRMFAEKVAARMPLLFLTPGKQVFMESSFSSSDRSNVVTALTNLLTGDDGTDVSSLVSGSGKYYTFEFAYDKYFTYVNAMANAVAYFMGIGDQKVTIGNESSTLGTFNWSNALNSSFKSFFSASECIVFYLDGLSSVSESFSNSTTESSLASTINGYSDTAKEIQFLFGGSDSVINTLLESAGEATESITNSLSSMMSKFDGGGILSSLIDTGVTSVLQGGKIIFPELWSDFQYERSYSLDIKLRCPDHDSLSIYLDILIPYIHLLAMCLPREVEDDPNAYTSPFLVRAFCKGMFSIDMGLITSMSVTKGAECCWNDDGLPTQIDISLEIKDLYSTLFISGYDDPVKQIVSNTSLMDFLANMAGLNVAQMEISRKYYLWAQLTYSKFVTTPSRIWTRFDNKISNIMYKLYKSI